MLKQIKREIEEFQNTEINIVDGFSFNQKKTIERIYRYLNSKFRTGSRDNEGQKKHFYNVILNPCGVERKATDFDLKDIKMETTHGGDPNKTWYMERDLKSWMKEKNFSKVLNRIFDERPKFGSVVIKTIKGVPYFVDLRNFVVEQTTDTLDAANYIIETHLYTPVEFKRLSKKLGWKKADLALEKFREMNDETHLTVYERYGEYPDENSDYKYQRIIIADVGRDEEDSITKETIPHAGVVLQQETIENHPYFEFHRLKIPGRWLGVGVVETLFEPQVRHNEIANLEAKGDYYAALHVWQTRGEDVNINLNDEVVDGQVLTSDSRIDPIDMTERNLSYFNLATEKWMKNRDELSFAYDVVQGERLPAGTPLGSAQLAAFMSGGWFNQLREDIAIDVKEYLFKKILPWFEQENSKEHILRIAGNDLDKVRKTIISHKATEALFDFIKRKKSLPDKKRFETIKAAIEEKVKQGKEILAKIPENFYKNLKDNINIIITGEQKDITAFTNDLIFILQAITADPTALTNPIKRKILFRIMEARGIRPADLDLDEETEKGIERLIPEKGVGGGVSRPQIPTIAPASAETRV